MAMTHLDPGSQSWTDHMSAMAEGPQGKIGAFYVNRQLVRSFPLITRFAYTGEPLNPWRCESCLTKPQRRDADLGGVRGIPSPSPGCCRKCGVDFWT
jgi:hypothetical protein